MDVYYNRGDPDMAPRVVSFARLITGSPALKRAGKRADRRARRMVASLARGEPRYTCPVCGWTGVFLRTRHTSGQRRWAECARCGALERHRLQAEVFTTKVFPLLDRQRATCLQVAPDPMTPWIRSHLPNVVTADLWSRSPEVRADVRTVSFADESFDLVHASHVLEHIDDDGGALAEIRRVLKPGGIATLPVPLNSPTTIEYDAPNPHEKFHVRAPGPDYFDRYRVHFGSVEVVTSAEVRQGIQPWIYEDREKYPTPSAPMRRPMCGERHIEAVPICHK